MSHIDHEAIADALIEGQSMQSSLLAGGHTESVSKQGKKHINAQVTSAMARKLDKAKTLGGMITPADQERIVRGHLLMNALQGKDNAVRSLELLGKDKSVNMFAADSQLGVIVLNVPMSITHPVRILDDNENEL